MIVSDELVARYFAPPREPLWRWSPDGSAITTMGGKTIAFKQEAEIVLERLAPRGLPPFGAIVLLLAACREGWSGDVEVRGAIAQFSSLSIKSGGTEVAQAVDAMLRSRIAGILKELDRIHALQSDVRRSAQGKAFLAESIFETIERAVKPADAEAIVQGLKRGIPREMLQPVEFDGGNTLLADLDALCRGTRLNDEKLNLRYATGLDELPVPAEKQDPLPERARKLIELLRNEGDSELAGLARLALDLLAAVHVPRQLAQRDELPLGGFTDISNRGHLDRLLLSELAHDDLTLSVRVALNEALYLRREAPPRNPPRQRAILIDCGIRMWGLPRAFAAAAALALIATADRESVIRCWRAATDPLTGRESLLEADLTTHKGLIEQLGALETAPHPAGAVQKFLKQIQEQPEPSDAILITHPDVVEDAEFKAALERIPDLSLYAASVDRDGHFRLLHYTPVGHTVLREALYPLESIFAPREEPKARPDPTRPPPLRDTAIDPMLPVILSLQEFPFLLPHAIEPRRCRFTPKGVLYTVTNDGRLMRRENLNAGARQLSDTLPLGGVRRVFVEGELDVYALIEQQSPHKMVIFHAMVQQRDDRTHRTQFVILESRKSMPLEAFIQNGLVVIIFPHCVDVYNPDTGKRLHTYEYSIDNRLWVYGRFFKSLREQDGKTQWYQLALSTPSGRVALIEHAAQNCIALIERQSDAERIGPWALSVDGALTPITNGEGIHFDLRGKRIARLLSISDDETELIVEFAPNEYCCLEITSGKACTRQAERPPYSNQISKWLRSPKTQILSNVQCVGLAEDNGALALRTQSGTYRLRLVATYNRIELEKRKVSILNSKSFSRSTRPEGARYGLQVARFQDGSSIYLDSRGMLHLQSSDKRVPQITLVLHPEDVACWSSDGERYGSAFFLPGGAKRISDKIFSSINEFVRRLR